MERRLSAILAADVVGYSALMEQDEAGTFDRLRTHRKELFEPEIEKHHGRIFKLTGDGLFAEFSSVVDAVECAVSLQRGLIERNVNVPDDKRIDVRIGINLGEVIVEGDDRLGEGVNIAARLEQLAEPGGICVSGKVTKEVEKKLAFGFEAMGEKKVKNIAEPISVFKVKMDALPRRIKPKRQQPPWWTWAGAAVAVIAAIVGVWFLLARPQTASATIPSIAVLPFDNMSGDPNLGYFSDGVSEDIISMLARATDFSVIARNSSFTYKGKPVDVRQVGKDLGVDYVLEGSVRKDADKVRIVAQLVDAKTGQHIWAERFDKTGTDPWALQDDVIGKIIGAIASEKGQMKRAQYRVAWGKDTANLQEYDYYLRGHDQFTQFTREGNAEAGRIWKEGLAKFPNSPLLQIKLGWYHMMEAYNGYSSDAADDFRRAGELVRKGLAQSTLSPLGRRVGMWLLSYVYGQEGDFERAVKTAEAAIAMSPNDAFMIGDLSQVPLWAGLTDKAIKWADFGLANDPANIGYYSILKGWALTSAERYEESQAVLVDAADYWSVTPLLRAINYVRFEKPGDAKKEVEKALKLDPAFRRAKWRQVSFASDPTILERQMADLAKAGVPE